MKTVKLLAALAVPAMFAACTSEDIVVENSQMVQKEIVGAELVGTGISLNVTGGDASSRIANVNGELKWTKTDLLGLGWLLTTNTPQEVQSPIAPKNSYVWANNMFQLEEGDDQSLFTTKGNIYVGWQFAYYPYEYQDFPGSYKYITINPTQETMDLAERYSQGFHVSARKFIEKKHLVNNQLTESFSVKKAVNTLYMTTKPVVGSTFETGKSLANLEITSVTINAGKEVFTDKALLLAKNLPVQGEEFTNNMKGWIKTYKTDGTTEGRNVSLTTNIDADYFVSNVDGTNRIMPIALPTYEAVELNPNDVTIEIEAGAGKFTIAYVDEDSDKYNKWAALNNEVIENLVTAYAEDGQMVNWTSFVQLGEIQLYDAIFAPDFTNVTNDNWASKVQLANDLELSQEEAEFTLAESINLYGKKLPTNGVTVKGTADTKLIVDQKSFSWTDKLIASSEINVEVAEGATLNLNKNAKIENTVTNEGTINVAAGAVLGNKEAGNLDNSNEKAIVYVKYDGQVYPEAGKHGVIALEVAKMTSKTRNVKAINEMIGASASPKPEAGSANVNTLVIDNYELNCQMTVVTEGTTGSIYTPGTDDTSDEKDLELAEVNLWIKNGGKVSSTNPLTTKDVEFENGGELAKISVDNVTVNGGEATISNGAISGDVTVKSGSATIADGNITGDVTVEAGSIEISNGNVNSITANGSVTMSNGKVVESVTLNSGESRFENVTIGGTLTIEAGANVVLNSLNTMNIKNIVSDGTLTANNDIIVAGDVTLNPKSITTLTDGTNPEIPYNKVIYYKGKYNDGNGSLNGRVTIYGDGVIEGNTATVFSQSALNTAVTDPNVNEVKLASGNYSMPTTTGDITIAGNVGTVITVNKPQAQNVTLSGVTVKGSGKYTGIQHSKKIVYENCVVKGTQCLYADEVLIKDCTVDLTEVADYIWTYGAKNVVFDNCIFNTQGKAILVYNERAGATNVTVKDCTFNASASAKASAIANQNCAAIEIDNFQESGIGTAHVVTTEGNVYSDNFSGEWRIKTYTSGNPITVNNKEYTSIAIDGKLMTIDAGKNVTVLD